MLASSDLHIVSDLTFLLLNSVSRRGIYVGEEKTRNGAARDKVERAGLMCEEGGQELSPG